MNPATYKAKHKYINTESQAKQYRHLQVSSYIQYRILYPLFQLTLSLVFSETNGLIACTTTVCSNHPSGHAIPIVNAPAKSPRSTLQIVLRDSGNPSPFVTREAFVFTKKYINRLNNDNPSNVAPPISSPDRPESSSSGDANESPSHAPTRATPVSGRITKQHQATIDDSRLFTIYALE